MTNKQKWPGLGHNLPKKTSKERSKSYNERKTEAGYRKVWVDPATLGRIDKLGSIDEVSAHHAQLERDTRNQLERIGKLEEQLEFLSEYTMTMGRQANQKEKAQAELIQKLEAQGQDFIKKNAELKKIGQERADLIADQTVALGKLRDDLEIERNRSLVERVMSSLFGR